jgi:hypothetical protein
MSCATTVAFHSIRMSRITAAKIYESFRTCHGSPKGSSNIQNKVTKWARNGSKNEVSRAHSAYSSKREDSGFALRWQLKLDEAGHW